MRKILFILLMSIIPALGETGKASWYSIKTNKGTRTASGIKLNNESFTAAHKTIKLGSYVKVTNLNNNKTAIVRVIDRGPYIRGRIIDVTVAVAKRLGFYSSGLARVKIEIIK